MAPAANRRNFRRVFGVAASDSSDEGECVSDVASDLSGEEEVDVDVDVDAEVGEVRVKREPGIDGEVRVKREPESDAEQTAVAEAMNVWVYKPCNGKDIGFRSEPAIEAAKAGAIMSPGQKFVVSEERIGDNNVTYLKCADGRGWLFDKKPGMGTMCVKEKFAYIPSIAPLPPAPEIDDGYPAKLWVGAPPPGAEGFNEVAVAALRGAGVASRPLCAELDQTVDCSPLQPHQEAAVFLLHPKSPITRMLVDHPTGSGKTREIISILDNYFHDPRAKVPIFPKEPVCRNFYAELLRWPNRYRDFFFCLRPKLAAQVTRGVDWRQLRGHMLELATLGDAVLRELCREMREVLEMKSWFFMGRMRAQPLEAFREKHPDEHLPAGPLRALRYTSAGGGHAALGDDGLPRSALFKIGFDREDGNVYSNKIVIMDEVHNLVRTHTQFSVQLGRLRELLSGAQFCVLAGFTGTPILSERQEGRRLLDIIKGQGAPEGDEGFISSFPMRPTPLFPLSLPRGVPDAALTPNLRRQFVRKVELGGECLQRYDGKRAKGVPERRLRGYCNMSVFFGAWHAGKLGSKARILDNFESCAPKMHRVASDVASEQLKALVLVDRRTGMSALLDRLRQLGAKQGFGVATMDEVLAFNSAKTNLHGESYRVMVADASTCSEGVSFFGVRRVYLVDVPQSTSSLIQAVGRSIRMYSHAGLTPEEQTVTTYIYAATLPRWMHSPLGIWALRAQKRHEDPAVMVKRARHLLRMLKRVGIVSLEDFKIRLDVYGRTVAPRIGGISRVEAVHKKPLQDDPDSAQKAVHKWLQVDPDSAQKAPESQTVAPASQGSEETLAEKAPESQTVAPASQGLEETLAEKASHPEAPESRAVAPASQGSEEAVAEKAQPSEPSRSFQPSRAEGEAGSVEAGVASVAVNSAGCAGFLESIGLWEEAKLIKSREQAMRAKPGQRGYDPRREQRAQTVKDETSHHYLVRALRTLHWMGSADEAVHMLNLGTLTADELALRSLSQKSRMLVPALEELRLKAVDRELLLSVGKGADAMQDDEEQSSEGESSEAEFGITSASSGDEGLLREAPLVLPPGWRVDKIQHKKGPSSRIFVSASGRVYRTEAQAKAAVAASRRVENMAAQMREKYAEKLAAKAAASAEAATSSSPPAGDGSGGVETPSPTREDGLAEEGTPPPPEAPASKRQRVF